MDTFREIKAKDLMWKSSTVIFIWPCNPSVCTTGIVEIDKPSFHFGSEESTQVLYSSQLNRCYLGSC